MKKSLIFFSAFFVFSIIGQKAESQQPLQNKEAGANPKTIITILSESSICDTARFHPEQGFSVLIEKDGRQYLYDTGRNDAPVYNARVLGKDLSRTEKIFLSHGHVDHTGGLDNMLKAIGHPVEIIAHPEVFGKKYAIWTSPVSQKPFATS